MMLIGLGKHEGAKIYHRAIQDYSWIEIVTAVGQSVLEKCSVVAGLAIVENSFDETAIIQAVRPADFLDHEKQLLVQAKQWMPRLPFDSVDLLIVDEIGKNVSGSGMDTNVIGRKYNDHAATDQDGVRVRRIFVRGLTNETHGNACGLGMAEVTNRRTIAEVDQSATAINALTGGHPSAAGLPIAFETDRQCIEAIIPTIGLTDPENARVVHITNTMLVGETLVSEAFADAITARDDLEVLADIEPMQFDDEDNLIPVAAAGAAVHA